MSKQKKISSFFNRKELNSEVNTEESSGSKGGDDTGLQHSEIQQQVLESGGRPEGSENRRTLASATTEKKNGQRLIQPYWFEKFPWLHCSDNILSCSVCTKHPNVCDKNSKLVLGYVTPFKVQTLKIHEKSKSHRNCADAELAKTTPDCAPLVKCVLKASQEQVKQMTAYFKIAYYIAYYSKPLQDFPKQIELSQTLGVQVTNNYANRSECTEFVNCISHTLRNNLLNDITNSPCGSVLVDGSTDVANQSCVVIYIRYIKNGDVFESFLALEPLESETADGYFKAIVNVFERLCVPYRKPGWLIGLGTDGAANMMGEKGGLGAKFKELCPQIIHTHCVAHRLQLAVLDSCSKTVLVSECEKKIRTIFKFYHNSPKRLRELKVVAAVLEEKIVKLRDLNSVRWVVSKRRTLEALLRNWHALATHLEDVSNTTQDGPLAKGILKFLLSFKYVKFCHFLLDFLNVFAPVSEAFQKEKIVITEVDNSVQHAIHKLEKLSVERGKMELQFEENYKDGQFHQIKLQNATQCENANVQVSRASILENGKKYLQSRFDSSRVPVLEFMKIFDTAAWPTGRKLADFGNPEIIQLSLYFKQHLPNTNEENILDEWYDLKQASKDLPFKSLCQHAIRQQERFQTLSKLMALIVAIPVSTSSCERGFSAMNNVKTAYRSQLSPKTTDSLLNINLNGVPLLEFNPVPSVHYWFSTAVRRPQF